MRPGGGACSLTRSAAAGGTRAAARTTPAGCFLANIALLEITFLFVLILGILSQNLWNVENDISQFMFSLLVCFFSFTTLYPALSTRQRKPGTQW